MYQPAARLFLSTLSLRRATTPNTFRHCTTYLFLSTLSLRRATTFKRAEPSGQAHFYPRSPCGERHHKSGRWKYHSTISIHALLAESDGLSYFYIIKITDFYPRSPCGERHAHLYYHSRGLNISIHALLAESDNLRGPCLPEYTHFYPRSPCGERRSGAGCLICLLYFYPRSPCGERQH